MKIYTLTLSPAIDVHAEADSLKLNKENLLKLTSREAGGKGINISRALFSYGVRNTPIILLGEENAEDYMRMLDKEKFSPVTVKADGRIRENVTVHTGGSETRLSFEGFCAPRDLFSTLRSLINISHGDILTFTGRLPKGASADEAKEFLSDMKEMGAKLVIDSNSLTLSDINDISPWLIKPNAEEISKYSGREINSADEAMREALLIFRAGTENVIVSLGKTGAVLACREGNYYVKAPKISLASTIGAGDSMIAGFISGYADGLSKRDCLLRAVAFGSSACETQGSNPPRREAIERLLSSLS